MNASIFFKSPRRLIHLDQVERVVLNALETAALPPGIFCATKALESGPSIRSTLALVYV